MKKAAIEQKTLNPEEEINLSETLIEFRDKFSKDKELQKLHLQSALVIGDLEVLKTIFAIIGDLELVKQTNELVKLNQMMSFCIAKSDTIKQFLYSNF